MEVTRTVKVGDKEVKLPVIMIYFPLVRTTPARTTV